MYQSHFFNYCQHCRADTAAIEQAVQPHASSTFLTLCIKARTLANSAALQTSSSSQEKASVAVQLLARLMGGGGEKDTDLPEMPITPNPMFAVIHGCRTSERAVELHSLSITL